MAGNSTLDQPNDNGPNASLKGYYNEVKDEWDEKFGTTKYTPPHLNSVIVEAWMRFSQRAAPIVVRAFEKTNLFPLQPPKKNDDNSAAGACTAAMQCSQGKKSMELELFAQSAINAKPYSVKHTSDPMTILRAKEDVSRNLLI